MYMRFVVTRIDEDSHRPQGVFLACYELLESGDLSRDERERMKEVIRWFERHLRTPGKFFVPSRAIFWFKAGAGEHIRRIWELVHMLREHGHGVEVYKCRRLANIVFEDDSQVAAYPSPRDGRITVQ